jgi:hypothetical protein
VTYHEEGVICTRTDDPDLYAVLGIPLEGNEWICGVDRKRTYAGVAVENIDVIARVEVVDGAFAVNFKSVCVGLTDEKT